MWLPTLLTIALIPLAAAQSSNSSSPSSGGSSGSAASPSPQITVITSVSTSIGFQSSGRQETTVLSTILITSTIPTASPTSAPAQSSSSAASSTTTANLPTGTFSVVTDQAPSPGATGGSFGPGDGFINAAQSLKWSALLVAPAAIVGGLLAL